MTTRAEVARLKDALAAQLSSRPRSSYHLAILVNCSSRGEVNSIKRFLLQMVDEGRASHSQVRRGTNDVHMFALPLPIAQAAE